MFSTKDYVQEKGQKSGRGRFEYLQALVTEFQDTDKQGSKVEVLANLANFAYDPLNYDYLRKLNVVDLFLDMLSEQNEKFVEFGMAGLCNLCLDVINRDHILKNGGIEIITGCLSSSNEETVLNAITTLMYLVTPDSKDEIVCDEIKDCMMQLKESKNPRLKNLALIFLEDLCSSPQQN
ncbi:armadillo repeat-containing protein 7 [Hydra vulgaris]|uniref:armadillo repeat-containing protein 7 n=1 Tax=Hydra vulgaris TaxID=6087 RepID=UPI000192522E|nr:armadillo repeat-containing protein 7-like [Hydra vulgaris]